MYSFAELRVMGGSDVLMAPQETKTSFFYLHEYPNPVPRKRPANQFIEYLHEAPERDGFKRSHLIFLY